MGADFSTLEWRDEALFLLDQTQLPLKEVYCRIDTAAALCQAIRTMIVRGAPAIGIAAAYGIALAAREVNAASGAEFAAALEPFFRDLAATRPTAVNLFWALACMRKKVKEITSDSPFSLEKARWALRQEAQQLHEADVQANRRLGALAQEVVPPAARVLTHCNAGSLATAGFGTALGVLYAAQEAGKKIEVFADETRPFLQGSRLTAWELQKNGIPVTLICDNMAGHLMKTLGFDFVIVGADRIARNGDVANKIGTYSLAILAREHNIPFYVAAPWSTLDLSLAHGGEIPIEERSGLEVLEVARQPIAPAGVHSRNPAFDITPHHLVTAILTERGVARPPFEESLRKFSTL